MRYSIKQRILAMCMAMLMVAGMVSGVPAQAASTAFDLTEATFSHNKHNLMNNNAATPSSVYLNIENFDNLSSINNQQYKVSSDDTESGVYLGDTKLSDIVQITSAKLLKIPQEAVATTNSAGDKLIIKGTFIGVTNAAYSITIPELEMVFDSAQSTWTVTKVEKEVETKIHDVEVKEIATSSTASKINFTSASTYVADKASDNTEIQTWKNYYADIETNADSGIYLNGTKVDTASLYWRGTTNFGILLGSDAAANDVVTVKGAFKYLYEAGNTAYIYQLEEISFKYDGSAWAVAEPETETKVHDVEVKEIATSSTASKINFTSASTYVADKASDNTEIQTWKNYYADIETNADSGIYLNGTKVDTASLYWRGTTNFGILLGSDAAANDVVTVKGAFKYLYEAGNTAYIYQLEEISFKYDGSAWAVAAETDDEQGGGQQGGEEQIPATIHPVEFTKSVSATDEFVKNPAKFVYIQSDTSYANDLLPHDAWQAYQPDTTADAESGIWRGETQITDGAYIEKVSATRYRLRFGATDDTLAETGETVTVKGVFTYSNGTTSYSFRVEETKFIYTGANWKVYVNTQYRDLTLTKFDPTVAPKVSSNGFWGFYLIPSVSVTDFAVPWQDQFNDVVIQIGDTTVTRYIKVAYEANGLYFSIPTDILPEVIEENTKITVYAGEYDMSTDNTKGIRLTQDCVIYANKYGFSLTGFVEEIKASQSNVALTLDRDTAYGGTENGLYLNTTDSFPVDTTWATHIYAVSYDDNSGIYFNGEKLKDSSIRRYADGKIYLSLKQGGVQAQDKDKVTVKGLFALGTKGIHYKEVSFYYNGKTWDTTYTPAPPESYTKIKGVSLNPATKYNETRGWDVYINVSSMLPGEIHQTKFESLTIEVNGHVYERHVSHSHEHSLFVLIEPKYLPADAADGTKITIKAGKALAADKVTGIELTQDFVFYVFRGGLTELEPTTNTKWKDIEISNLYRTRSFVETSNMWAFHLKTKQTLDLEQSTKLYDLQAEINGKMQKIEASIDGGMLYIKIRDNILSGNTKVATIKIKAGATAIGNAGRDGLRIKEDWTGYIYNGVISETQFDEVIRTEVDIKGIQYVAKSETSYGVYIRVNKEIPGTDWYEYYEDFVYYYNGKAIKTHMVRSISSNHKYLYFPMKLADIGTPKEGDIVTIKPNTVATCGGYEIAIMNEFKMMFSDGMWSAYVETDITAPEATGSVWEELRFDNAYIPTTEDGSVTFAGTDEYNKISTMEDYKDYTMKFRIKKSYDDEDTMPFRFILRGAPVSETEAMSASLLYGYVLTFEPAKIKDADGEYSHHGAYIHLWKNGENNALKDAYRLHYVYDTTENPFFKYDEYYDFEASTYNITDTCVCISLKVNDELVLRYYDEAGSDPFDPAINDGQFVIQSVAPATVQGEIVELDAVIAEADECVVGEKVRVSATYPAIIEGAEFTVDNKNATVKEGVFKAEKAGTYTVSCNYNGKELTSKVITVTEKEGADEVSADKGFPVIPVIISGITVILAAGIATFVVISKKKKGNIQA